jgi:hypothetical protein
VSARQLSRVARVTAHQPTCERLVLQRERGEDLGRGGECQVRVREAFLREAEGLPAQLLPAQLLALLPEPAPSKVEQSSGVVNWRRKVECYSGVVPAKFVYAFCVFVVVRVASTAIGVGCGAGRVFERLSVELHLFVAPARLEMCVCVCVCVCVSE